MSGAIAVVAAAIRREGRYLVGRRPAAKRHGGLWEFPGGKVHEGESRLEAVRRELAEELDMRVASLGALLLSVHDQGSPFVIEFYDVEVEGAPTAREHDAIGWFTPAEMSSMPLAPADARFVASLLQARR